MIDLAAVEPRHYDAIAPVIAELTATISLDPDNILLIGAGCRDILHAAFGHTFTPRATTDMDLGLAVDDWAVSTRIDDRFHRLGSNGIRYSIAGISVDIMPFGPVEDPEGITRPSARGEELVVFGFRDVYERALRLHLPGGLVIRLPRPAGYAALKMRSWIDRSSYGEDKDARDLALVNHWYQGSPAIDDRLYGPEDGRRILIEQDMDAGLAATRLLARDVAAQLSPSNLADLKRRWEAADLDALARSFTLPASGPRSPHFARRRTIAGLLSPKL